MRQSQNRNPSRRRRSSSNRSPSRRRRASSRRRSSSQSSSRHWRRTPSPGQRFEREPEEDEEEQGLERQPDPKPYFQESRGRKARNARKEKRAKDAEIQARRAKGEQDGFPSAPPAKEMTPGSQRWRRVKELQEENEAWKRALQLREQELVSSACSLHQQAILREQQLFAHQQHFVEWQKIKLAELEAAGGVQRLGKKPKTASQSSSRSWADQTEEEADWDRDSQDECQGLETKPEPEPAKDSKLEKLNKLWGDKAAERKKLQQEAEAVVDLA